jgi:hypothetical protein
MLSKEQEPILLNADPTSGVEKQLEQALSQGLELEEWKSLSTIQAVGTANTLRALRVLESAMGS